jgi:hypothetical protein
MSENIYKIRRSFILPLVAIVILLLVLLTISLFNRQLWEAVALAVPLIISLAVSIEAVRREIIVTDQGLILKKFFRRKDFTWTEITDLSMVTIKKKVYFLLTTTRGFHIFTNLLENNGLLIRNIMDKLGEAKVEVEVKNYLDHPIERRSLIVMSWVAVLIIAAVILLKVSGI